jgi:predicted nuclease of predicted toxin-antitoxin system
MRILLDECVPRKLKFMLIAAGHDCETARDAGFGGMTNGKLLAAAELLFEVLVTIDRNIQYQQNLASRNIAILVLCAYSNDISDIQPLVSNGVNALKSIKPGQVVEIATAN